MQFRPSGIASSFTRVSAGIYVAACCVVGCTAPLPDEEQDSVAEAGGKAGQRAGGHDQGGAGGTALPDPEVDSKGGGGTTSSPPRPPAPLSLFESQAPPAINAPDSAGCPVPGATVEPAQSPSDAFMRSCAGCHGPRGQGIGAFPALSKVRDFTAYKMAVREGRNGKMPAFGSEWLTDAELFTDWVTVTGQPAKPPENLACAQSETSESWTHESYVQTITRGLETWRKPDAHEGAACASCHGPAPFDLAYIGYDDATIMRRALLHLPQQDGFAIIAMVHALRGKFGLAQSRDFMAFRPFQPGGRVLGADPAGDFRDQEKDGAQADHVFGLELEKAMPTLAGPPLQTIAEAERARDEFLNINPRRFPIAVALNRWTEDKHRGVAHASLADWVPDRPHLPNDRAAEQALYAVHDAYLRSPDWQGVLAVENATLAQTKVAASGSAAELFTLKFRSVLYAQHQFLLEAAGRAGLAELGAAPFPHRNSVWNVGDFARLHRTEARACMNAWAGCLDLPQESTANIDQSGSVIAEIERIKFSWFWVGWQFDLSLYRTSNTNSTNSAEYFLEHLYQHGYYNHAWYMRLRKNLSVAYELVPESGGSTTPAGILDPGAQNWSYVFGYGRGLAEKSLPPLGAKRDLYLRMMTNAARMFLRLTHAQLATAGPAASLPASVRALPDSTLVQFVTVHGNDPSDAKLIEELRARLR